MISAVFGAQNGLNIATNQATLYAQAPADSTGWWYQHPGCGNGLINRYRYGYDLH